MGVNKTLIILIYQMLYIRDLEVVWVQSMKIVGVEMLSQALL